MNLTIKIFVPVIVAAMLLAVFLPLNVALNFFHDDSFFYIKTAGNFAAGLGSTFDTVNVTNGYHPLWFIILSGVFALMQNFVTLSPELILRFVFVLNFFIVALILFVNYKLLSNILPVGKLNSVFVILILVLVIPVLIRDFGVESQLAVLLISVYLWIKSKEIVNNTSGLYFKAILISLLFLTRTDYLYSIIPAILLAEFFTTGKTIRTRTLTVSAILLCVTVVIYFSFNYYYFGYILPVSAAISNSFPDTVIGKNFSKLFYSPNNMLNITCRFALVVLSLVVSFVMLKKELYDRRFSVLLFALNAGAVLFCIGHLVFNNYGLREWYITMPNYIAILTLVLYYPLYEIVYKVVIVCLLLLVVAGFYKLRISSEKFESVLEYALILKQNTSADDRIFQTDFSGIVGFFSERSVINGDGFINSYEYRDYVLSGRLDEYFRDKQINFYSTYTFNKPDQKGEVFTDFIAGIYIADYEALIPRKDEVLKLSYGYTHGLSSYHGFWYLFRVGEGFRVKVIEERPS